MRYVLLLAMVDCVGDRVGGGEIDAGATDAVAATDVTSVDAAADTAEKDAAALDVNVAADAPQARCAGKGGVRGAGPICVNERYVFVTPKDIPSNFALGMLPLAAAALRCKGMADAGRAELRGRTWDSWLYVGDLANSDPRLRLAAVNIEWITPSLAKQFGGWSPDFVANFIPGPALVQFELADGMPVAATHPTWTGELTGLGARNTCGDWQLGVASLANIGDAHDLGRLFFSGTVSCGQQSGPNRAALYCFEKP
jgi:hypothetical protein